MEYKVFKNKPFEFGNIFHQILTKLLIYFTAPL